MSNRDNNGMAPYVVFVCLRSAHLIMYFSKYWPALVECDARENILHFLRIYSRSTVIKIPIGGIDNWSWAIKQPCLKFLIWSL